MPLFLAALAIALVVDFLLLAYVLTGLPQVHPGRRGAGVAAAIGAVGFELLKLLLTGYLQGVAAKSMCGAFAVPVALLLWINRFGLAACRLPPRHRGRPVRGLWAWRRPAGQVLSRRLKNERYRWSATRRSSVATSSPRCHWPSRPRL
ncbi:YihY/virulence factor BrkB family protein [Streptomyces griseocarneus]|nr:YihY/virulence factor BrkB family protein [Streptomyces griseocarneus]GHG47782.1 hypothetical protein GCM10018779_05370 [Streptomyces griseocarneus]